MGNSQSQSSESKSNATSPTSPTSTRHVARRKHSAHALSHAHQKTGAPPTASLISTSSTALPATQPTRAHAHATVAQSPASSHTRARSITTPRQKPEDSSVSQRSDSSVMGSESSKHQRPPSRTSTLPAPSHAPASHAPSPTSDERPQPSPSTRPVNVPQSSNYTDKDLDQTYPSGLPDSGSPYGLPPSNFSRPPRLPLPIEEVHTPGSPIITPQDISSPIGQADINGLPRRASVLSSTTVDDEDVGDNEAFTADQASLAPSVPMPIEWKGPGEKVYVTGTFVQWDRKFKLHRDKKGEFSTTLQLKPGTHHLKFLVDGDMTTSHELPTTVDYTNILVNYIEVVAPLPESADKQAPAPAEPMPIPGAALTKGQVPGTGEADAQTIPSRPGRQGSETESGAAGEAATSEAGKAVPIPSSQTPQASSAAVKTPQQEQQQPPEKKPRQPLPTATYTKQIPQFLLDLDTYNNPHDERFQRASRVINTLPQPPSLPMFLGKSILNGNTPHKDDASVLIMPNHTVLNHLATSSIKNGVLATSGTTRYKRKFLTTIMYKPTSDDG